MNNLVRIFLAGFTSLFFFGLAMTFDVSESRAETSKIVFSKYFEEKSDVSIDTNKLPVSLQECGLLLDKKLKSALDKKSKGFGETSVSVNCGDAKSGQRNVALLGVVSQLMVPVADADGGKSWRLLLHKTSAQ